MENLEYTPHKMGTGINPHVLWTLGWYGLFSALFVAGLWLMLTYFPHFSPDDPEVQLRFLFGKWTTTIAGIGTVLGMVVVLELITNGNLFGRILSNAIACVLLVGIIVACGTAIYIYA